ncbi:MAG TPA: hypothetical protein VFC17_01445 [Candidatus Limnocylindrales bacterium]|nr:hypothetical protein [Candidatus Limnocylindrales bacterium]
MKPIIHHDFSRRWLGVGMLLVAAMAAQAQTAVTFQIDMASVSPAPTAVYISGSFNGWPGFTAGAGSPAAALINTSGTIWSNTISVSDAPSTIETCKFQYEPGDNWEGDPNRQFVVGPAGPAQVLPLTSWNVKDWPAPTNRVTFQLNMSEQIAFGNFTNGLPGNSVAIAGDFIGWGTDAQLTNNPSLTDTRSNLYTGTYPVVGFLPTTINCKFRVNNLDGGYESPASTGGNNRAITITSANQVLPVLNYDDLGLGDLVYSNITVTFSVFVTNGTPNDSGGTYTKGTDTIWVSGNWLGWPSWGFNALPANQQMFESATPNVYTNSFVIARGTSIYIDYKYSFDGLDNENGANTNHVREIRSYGPTYAFPQDVWSYTYVPGSNTTTNIVEQDFGNLKIGAPSGGRFPITWLGRPAVVLQSRSSLSSGLWTNYPGTDATQSTNWPASASGPVQFFRLIKN